MAYHAKGTSPQAMMSPEQLKASTIHDPLMLARRDLLQALLDQSPAHDGTFKSAVQCILHMNLPWHIKYPNPIFTQLLVNNCMEKDWVEKLISCLSILEKYARNLLRLPESRPSGWQNLNFSIHVFKTKVGPVIGSQQVLIELGYTLPTRVGLQYPPNTEPDRLRVAAMAGDIIMVHHELLGYSCHTHPRPTIIEDLLLVRQAVPGFATGPYSLPVPSWSNQSSVSSDQEDLNTCKICGQPPMFQCVFCKQNLCEGCDYLWHQHQARNQHHRTPINRSPVQNLSSASYGSSIHSPILVNGRSTNSPDRSPTAHTPSPTQRSPNQVSSPPDLPTVIESAHTLNSKDGEALRSQIGALSSDKDSLPSGVPKLSIFLTEPSREEIEADIEDLTSEINQIIANQADFYMDPVYKALRVKHVQAQERLRMLDAETSNQAAAATTSASAGTASPPPWSKPKITTPPTTIYKPPTFNIHPTKPSDKTHESATPPPMPDLTLLGGAAAKEQDRWTRCTACGCSKASDLADCPACKLGSGGAVAGSTSFRNNQTVKTTFPENRYRWHCIHCTLINHPSVKKKCDACGMLTENPVYVGDDDEDLDISQMMTTMTLNQSGPGWTSSLTTSYQREREEELIEKKKAQLKYAQSQKQDESPSNLASTCSSDSWPIIKTLPRRSKSCQTAQVSSPPEHSALKTTHSVGSSLSSCQESFAEEKRLINMFEEGKALVEKLKAAEKANFGPEEFELGYREVKEGGDVLHWLRTKWSPTIETVIQQVAQVNPRMPIKISHAEARQALLEASGDLTAAVQNCIHIRLEKVSQILSLGFSQDEKTIHRLLGDTDGSVDETLTELNIHSVEPFVQRLTAESSYSKDTLSDPTFTGTLLDESIDRHRRIRMLLAEGKLQSWGRAENVMRLLQRKKTMPADDEEDWSSVQLTDIVEIVKGVDDFKTAVTLLQQTCSVCLCQLPETRMKSLVCCECKVCGSCLAQHFDIRVREHHVRQWVCPCCSQPDMEDEEKRDAHFQFMELLLKDVVKVEVFELFEQKLRDWSLMKDPNFRWCSHCDFGFLFNSEEMLRMTCPKCHRHTCFQCKKPWEVQHEDTSCEEFQAWKEANDPELQAQGLAKILEENGIDCPGCNFRYSLAKGGCMHFKCTSCAHEFCSGCHRPFKRGETCGKFETCRNEGLHCHHPRHCLFYLRDYNVTKLQKLLNDHTIHFDIEKPPGGEMDGEATCPVQEQKEEVDGLKDEACGRKVPQKHAGLCEVHYKEYLVGLINKNHIDPMEIMTEQELVRVLERSHIPTSPKRKRESKQEYRAKLVEAIKQQLPLPPSPKTATVAVGGGGQAMAPLQQQGLALEAPRSRMALPEEGVRRVPEENAEAIPHWI